MPRVRPRYPEDGGDRAVLQAFNAQFVRHKLHEGVQRKSSLLAGRGNKQSVRALRALQDLGQLSYPAGSVQFEPRPDTTAKPDSCFAPAIIAADSLHFLLTDPNHRWTTATRSPGGLGPAPRNRLRRAGGWRTLPGRKL